MVRALGLAVIAACGGATAPAVNKAGDSHDEGAGELARASMRLSFGGPDQTQASAARTRGRYGGDTYGGDIYGGDPYGGDPYGGASYAGWAPPQWNYTTVNRAPPYSIGSALPGSIEGAVTWTGAPAQKLDTRCGKLENPTLRVGSDRTMRGVLVYIEKVSSGRSPPYYGRPASVGGVVVKHGCALLPAAQVVSPMPASLAIHGDSVRTKVSVGGKAYDLQEGGLVSVELKAGVTRVDGDGMVPAWAIALETPYYAITDDRGRFRIDELAAGTYDVTFWQAPVATSMPDGTISVGAPVVAHRTVRIDGAKPVKLDVALH
jgi:hypothetical protein